METAVIDNTIVDLLIFFSNGDWIFIVVILIFSSCALYPIPDTLHGTGSYPCPPQGWQEQTLFVVSQLPFSAPCFFIASIPYCEQEGSYLQELPVNGDKISLYIRMKVTKTMPRIFSIVLIYVNAAERNYCSLLLFPRDQCG